MLYVSLEKTTDLGNNKTNRFADASTDTNANAGETKYIMMLPFKLKAIDS